MLTELVVFAQYLLSQDLARSTARTYLAGLRAFARWWEPQRRPLRSLTADDVQRFILWRLEAGGSPRSVNHTLTALRHFCRWAKRRRRLGRDPMLQVANLPAPRTMRRLSPEAVERLLDVIRRDRSRRDRAMLLLLLRGGLKPSELVALRMEDLVLERERRELRLRSRRSGAPASLLLDQELATALQAYIAGSGRLRGPLFADQGRPLTVHSIERLIACYGSAAGVSGLRWRVLHGALRQAGAAPSPSPAATAASLLELACRALMWRNTGQSPAFT